MLGATDYGMDCVGITQSYDKHENGGHGVVCDEGRTVNKNATE